jgi:CelD/BcsL family acetyltransferase involved in cellulose biosynthesis
MSPSGLDVHVVTDEVEFAGLKEQWDALAGTIGDRSLFASHTWLARSWQRQRAMPGRRLNIVLIRDSGGLVLAAPLVRVSGWLSRGTLRALDSLTPQYNDILVRPDRLPQATDAFWRHIRSQWGIGALRMSGVRDDSATAAVLRAAPFHIGLSTVAPALDLSPHTTGDSWFAARSPASRYKYRRQLKALRQRGDTTFHRITGGVPLENAVRWLFRQKGEWVARRIGKQNWLTQPETASFFVDITQTLAASGEAWVDTLELDGEPVAATLIFHRGGTIFTSKLAYDPARATHSPGWLLMTHIIMSACDAGLRTVDLMLGSDEWKLRFGCDAIVTVDNYRIRTGLPGLGRWR